VPAAADALRAQRRSLLRLRAAGLLAAQLPRPPAATMVILAGSVAPSEQEPNPCHWSASRSERAGQQPRSRRCWTPRTPPWWRPWGSLTTTGCSASWSTPATTSSCHPTAATTSSWSRSRCSPAVPARPNAACTGHWSATSASSASPRPTPSSGRLRPRVDRPPSRFPRRRRRHRDRWPWRRHHHPTPHTGDGWLNLWAHRCR
jgi:hypothetical protein